MKKKMTQKMRRQMKTSRSIFARLYRIQNHFFADFADWLNDMNDPRHPSYILYTQAVIILQFIFKCICGIVSMRGMTKRFNTDEFIANLSIISGQDNLTEKPDWQTGNNYLERLKTKELEKIRYEMIRKLIRTKQFKSYTVEGSYIVIIDGTDIAYFPNKHCEHDLVKKTVNKETGEEKLQYYHKTLEAKILLGPGLILSIATEFIENEKEDVSKQDCELNAGYRLLDKLKKAFPKQKFLIVGDALYAVMPFMHAVREKNWDYLFRIKSGRQENLMKDFDDLLTQIDKDSIVKDMIQGEDGTAMFVNNVDQVTDKPEVCNMIRYVYLSAGERKEFNWVTSMEITRKNVRALARAGRSRWKIENEGFNFQKNGIYELEHHCSLDWNAMKNHYLIVQIADILRQLMEAFDEIVYRLDEGSKHWACDLLTALVSRTLTEEDMDYVQKPTALHMRCCLVG